MTSTRTAPPAKAKRLASEAWPLAYELVELLSPACERLLIAGSLRRGIQYVGDVEILAVPKFEKRETPGLFTSEPYEVNLLDELALQLKRDGVLADRPDKNGRPAWGSKFKRALYQGFGLDLFSVTPPAEWGAICVIRTGPDGYSRQLVTRKGQKFRDYTGRWRTGCMPADLREEHGALWRGAELVPTPEEADFYQALGLEFVKPEDRR